MTDGESFLFVFAVIYATDCVVWLNQSAYALISFARPRFHVRRASVQFAPLRGGLAILNPLPPLGTVFVAQAWPVAVTREGLAPFSLENPNPGGAIFPQSKTGFLRWEEIEKVTADHKKLRINGRVFAVFSTRHLCSFFASRIGQLARLEPGQRKAAISDWLKRSFSSRQAGRIARWFRGATLPLRWICNTLFVAAFLLLPLCYWLWGDSPRFFLALGTLWLLMIQAALSSFFLHRRLFPAQPGERWMQLLFSLFLPQYAIRSIDPISKGLLSRYHPLAISAATASRDDFETFAGKVWRDASHPVVPSEEGPTVKAARQFHEGFFVPALRALLDAHEFDIASAGSPPHKTVSAAICPRCLTPFERRTATCEDCGDLPVIPWESDVTVDE